jgi:hypothetical protein
MTAEDEEKAEGKKTYLSLTLLLAVTLGPQQEKRNGRVPAARDSSLAALLLVLNYYVVVQRVPGLPEMYLCPLYGTLYQTENNPTETGILRISYSAGHVQSSRKRTTDRAPRSILGCAETSVHTRAQLN